MRPLFGSLRAIHLGAGLFAAVFLLAYGVSAVQMAYRLDRPQPRETVRTIEIPADLGDEPRALASWLMARHGLRGDLTKVERRRRALRFEITRPGTVHRVEAARDARRVRVKTSRHGAIGMLNRLHHAGGFDHDDWAINAWGMFVLTGSLALLVLAGSGVAMWWLRHRHLRLGVPIFVGMLVSGLTLLVLVRMA